MAVGNGLFPPLIDAVLPAIVVTNVTSSLGGINIKFNISQFNTLSLIESVHVSITRQSNYNSLLDASKYPLGICIINKSAIQFNGDEGVLTVPNNFLNLSELAYNEYFKIQLRFSKDTYTGIIGQDLTNYLVADANLARFSEWSTVGLVRFIANHYLDITLNNLTDHREINSSSIVINATYNKTNTSGVNDGINNGKNDKEYLKSYKVVVKNSDQSQTLFESDNILVDINSNLNIYYRIPYYFESSSQGTEYFIKIYYITSNLYEGMITTSTQVKYSDDPWGDQSPMKVAKAQAVDSVIGKVNITLSPAQGQSSIAQGSKFVIRRASDKDNFQYWDTVWEKTLTSAATNPISYNDFTIESGVLYKYEVIYTDTNNHTYSGVNDIVISVFDHAFLTGEGTQLCVKFNPNITTFKYNVSDNTVTTLGGKYPYVNRNGAMNYRSFNLTGTIAYEMDAEHQFATRNSIYGSNIEIYGSYFVNRYINAQNDRITQREFRERVMDFLYSDMPKLFRSTPEGNILVRLTDINLTPNQQLSRMLYDFSCTATEIGEANIDNCKLYGIQDFGDS